MNKTIFILSGPAGVGKTTIWHKIEHRVPHIAKIITTTSRDIRPGEINGVDYHFLSRADFEAKITAGDFIEYATVHTNLYGSTFSELDRILSENKNPLYIIEPQGMVYIKPVLEEEGYQVKTIFLLPPSIDELKKRLSARGTETPEQYAIRLNTALQELEQKNFYDIQVLNDDLETAQNHLIKIFSDHV
ncbi:guanylate kinase [Candidatus Gracilibacteria bacterium]|nr:guanylate kinase [Candidatus Gracilibacteria bacterium]